MDLRNAQSFKERNQLLGKKLQISLSAIQSTVLSEREFTGHCENAIGAVHIPLGIAGPLSISGDKEYFVPLATTEGALVASVNRGCKAIGLSGGAMVDVEHVGMSRGPVFETQSISDSRALVVWVGDHFSALQQVAEGTSGHLKLVAHQSKIVGRSVFLRFVFHTMDAMGMNMATIATQSIVDRIVQETGETCIALAGNFDIDKKPAWMNAFLGRGYSVNAEVVLLEEVMADVLKTGSDQLLAVVEQKSHLGSMVSGSLGFNAHYANIIAAFYAATGQDLAHTVEGSLGITTARRVEKGVAFCVTLPAVIVGTVGGGTGLPTQKEALAIMGLAGGNEGKHALTLAKVVGAAVLAGELSLTASIAQGSLAQTHASFRKRSRIT